MYINTKNHSLEQGSDIIASSFKEGNNQWYVMTIEEMEKWQNKFDNEINDDEIPQYYNVFNRNGRRHHRGRHEKKNH